MFVPLRVTQIPKIDNLNSSVDDSEGKTDIEEDQKGATNQNKNFRMKNVKKRPRKKNPVKKQPETISIPEKKAALPRLTLKKAVPGQ
jgi:hypothetical protein